MNIKETAFIFFLTLALAGCGGSGGSGGSSDSGDSVTQQPITETPPTFVSGFTLEQRRAHKEIINAEYAENRSITGAGVKVAVFDSGTNINHSEFGGRSIHPDSGEYQSGDEFMTKEEHQFLPENLFKTKKVGPQIDKIGHGTAVATMIYGDVGGIANGVDLLIVKAMQINEVLPNGIVAIGMIDKIANNGFDFISLSSSNMDSFRVSDDFRSDERPFWYQLAVRDVGFINSAGNNSNSLSEIPLINPEKDVWAAKDDTVAPQFLQVGAIDENGALAEFSNFPGIDEDFQKRFILAPGTNIVAASHFDNENLVSVSGTSFSAPIVTAAAALVKSQNPTLSNRSVLTILLESADRSFAGYDPELHGQGILDIEAALTFDTSGLE